MSCAVFPTLVFLCGCTGSVLAVSFFCRHASLRIPSDPVESDFV